MKLLKNGRLVEDDWIVLPAGTEPPPGGRVVLPVARWLAERDTLMVADAALGLRLPAEQPERVREIAGDLPRFGMITVVFPTFRDGRGYSIARLLRERYRYGAELRADGPLLPDQFRFLHRCGFDAVTVPDERRLIEWTRFITEITDSYQPGADRSPSVLTLRHGPVAAAPGRPRDSGL